MKNTCCQWGCRRKGRKKLVEKIFVLILTFLSVCSWTLPPPYRPNADKKFESFLSRTPYRSKSSLFLKTLLFPSFSMPNYPKHPKLIKNSTFATQNHVFRALPVKTYGSNHVRARGGRFSKQWALMRAF